MSFTTVNNSRLESLSELSGSAFKVYILLLSKIERIQGGGEPKKSSNPFKITWMDFKIYGIPKKSFYRSLRDLEKNEFIRITGKRKLRFCELLKY